MSPTNVRALWAAEGIQRSPCAACWVNLRTRSAVLLPVLEVLDERLRFALVGPPVRDVGPQVAVATADVVFVGHNHVVARSPQVPES